MSYYTMSYIRRQETKLDILLELDPRKSRRSFEGLDINWFLDPDASPGVGN